MSDKPVLSRSDTSRIDELEIKLAYAEDLLDSLNRLVATQSEQIEAMGRELVRLRDRIAQSQTLTGEQSSDPDDEKPPHY